MSMSDNRNEDVNPSTPLPVAMGRAASSPSSFELPSTFPAHGVSMRSSASAEVLAEMKLDWTAADATFGPNVFERRRQLWASGQPLDDDLPTSTSVASGLNSSKGSKGHDRPKRSNPSAEALKRLDDILASPNVDTDDEIWKSYLSDVHGRLVGGNRLRRGFNLSQAVQILRIGWMRDGTWFGEEPVTITSAVKTPPSPPPATEPQRQHRGGVVAITKILGGKDLMPSGAASSATDSPIIR